MTVNTGLMAAQNSALPIQYRNKFHFNIYIKQVTLTFNIYDIIFHILQFPVFLQYNIFALMSISDFFQEY